MDIIWWTSERTLTYLAKLLFSFRGVTEVEVTTCGSPKLRTSRVSFSLQCYKPLYNLLIPQQARVLARDTPLKVHPAPHNSITISLSRRSLAHAYDDCAVHVGEEGWGRQGVSFGDVQLRAYVTNMNSLDLATGIHGAAFTAARKVARSDSNPKIEDGREGDWRRIVYSIRPLLWRLRRNCAGSILCETVEKENARLGLHGRERRSGANDFEVSRLLAQSSSPQSQG